MNRKDYSPREIERIERRKRNHQKYIVGNIIVGAVIIAVIVAVVIIVVSLVNKDKAPQQSAVTAAVTEQATAAPAPTQSAKGSNQNKQQATTPQSTQGNNDNDDDDDDDDDQQNPTQTSPTGTSSASASSDGSILHYYATGKTTGGYNWDYSGGSIVSINCTYNFSNQQYDFTIKGLAPGTDSFTLYYMASDDNKVAVPMTVSVDSNLNVTQIG